MRRIRVSRAKNTAFSVFIPTTGGIAAPQRPVLTAMQRGAIQIKNATPPARLHSQANAGGEHKA
jgi:hypothetical protein